MGDYLTINKIRLYRRVYQFQTLLEENGYEYIIREDHIEHVYDDVSIRIVYYLPALDYCITLYGHCDNKDIKPILRLNKEMWSYDVMIDKYIENFDTYFPSLHDIHLEDIKIFKIEDEDKYYAETKRMTTGRKHTNIADVFESLAKTYRENDWDD